MGKLLEEIVETVAIEEAPAIWRNLPAVVKREVVRRAAAEAPDAIKQVVVDLRPEIEQLLDLEHLVVDVLVTDLRLCVDVFIVCGWKELTTIRDTGALMGGILGVVQMVVWLLYDPWWLLPLISCIAGAITNWLALLLIFWPINPVSCCCGRLTFHGYFMRRQKGVAKAYANMVANDVLKEYRIVNELLEGAGKARVAEIVKQDVRRVIDKALAPVRTAAVAMGQEQRIERIKDRIADLTNENLYACMTSPRAIAYMHQAFDLERTLRTRMAALPHKTFESIMHPIFSDQEPKLVVLGAVIGAVFGALQLLSFEAKY